MFNLKINRNTHKKHLTLIKKIHPYPKINLNILRIIKVYKKIKILLINYLIIKSNKSLMLTKI
jgi:hypothetical protein